MRRNESGHHRSVALEATWLTEMFAEAGLPADQADRAGNAAMRRLLRRQRKSPDARPDARFRTVLTADPLVSVNRILGLGDGGLPFYDDGTGRVSEVDVISVLTEVGLEAAVALGFAKVLVEGTDPEQWYLPLWRALGHSGPLDIEELSRLDWSALRSEPDRGLPPLDPGPPPPPGRRGPRGTGVDLDAVRAKAPKVVQGRTKPKAADKAPASAAKTKSKAKTRRAPASKSG